MLYGYRAPQPITWSLAGASSPAFETDVRLSNGQPSEQTVISGVGGVGATISDYIDIRGDWAAPQALGAVALLNLSCAPGVRIEVTGRRLGDGGYTRALGGNSDSRTDALPDGRVQAIILPAATDTDFIGVQVRIYNDALGVTWADDETDLLIGEIAPRGAVILPRVQQRRERGRSARQLRERAANGAMHIAPRGEYDILSLNVSGTVADCHQGGLGGVDWDALRAMQDAPSHRVLVIPRRVGADGQIDYALCHRTAVFGVVSWGAEKTLAGTEMECPLTVEEAP